jgi:hypothetical protein
MRAQGLAALVLASLASGCSDPDVPEHRALVSSDCSGATQSARFLFPETDFETSCSGSILSGSCTTNESVGVKQSGDLEVERFVLTGLEETGPQRYELTFPDGTWCGWYVNAELETTEGPITDCYFGEHLCSAELHVDR